MPNIKMPNIIRISTIFPDIESLGNLISFAGENKEVIILR